MNERKQIWTYPDKKNGFLTLGYTGKRNIIYIRKSNNGKLFLHAGTYSADFMNEILDDRTLKYCFVKDIPNWKYTTKGKFFENHNMKNDSYIEVVQDEVVERLQEQLNEANEVIKKYADAMKQGYPNFDGTYTLDMAEIIDDKRIALSRTISDPRPADEYLEKYNIS